jgi:hypothetical protein
MITVTRTCDRCKAGVEANDQLWNVALDFQCYPKKAEGHGYLAPMVSSLHGSNGIVGR